MQEENQHTENVFAFNDEFKIIYIDDVAYVDRGTHKKYFCLGCKRQMQAVKPQTLRKAHFRHHVKPNSNETKCTYSDETYRHQLAKANAIDLKKIKVPSVYKFSPNKNEEKAFLIKESEFIEAHSVINEHYLFENDNGEIQVAKHYNELEGNHLFIKPDTIFLDENKNPILIVEFVATHKPDQQKLMKLKRLGINAIQVSVPKSSPEEIKDLFFKTNRTKWLFNHEENKADYFQLSESNARRVFEIDFEQRRLFEEGYACRKAQLGDFIRAIRRVLESESYKDTERNLRSEIRRVEENTEREAAELEELRRNHIESGVTQHRKRRDDVGNRKKEFQDYRSNLEERYFRKREEVITEQEYTDKSNRKVENDLSGRRTSERDIESVIEETRRIIRDLESEIVVEEGEDFEIPIMDREIRGRLHEDFREEEEDIESRIRSIVEQAKALPKNTRECRNKMGENYRSKIADLQLKINGVEAASRKECENFETEDIRIGAEIERIRRRIYTEREKEDFAREYTSEEYSKRDNFRDALREYQDALERLEKIEKRQRSSS